MVTGRLPSALLPVASRCSPRVLHRQPQCKVNKKIDISHLPFHNSFRIFNFPVEIPSLPHRNPYKALTISGSARQGQRGVFQKNRYSREINPVVCPNI